MFQLTAEEKTEVVAICDHRSSCLLPLASGDQQEDACHCRCHKTHIGLHI
jgi:hypothetical protein